VPDDGNGLAVLDLKTTCVDTWKAMIALQKTGKVKVRTRQVDDSIQQQLILYFLFSQSIGVSNYTQSMLEGIIKATGVTPAVNQIEAHPLLPQEDLVKYSNEKGIHITAYSPLGNAAGYGKDAKSKDILGSKPVQEVAKKVRYCLTAQIRSHADCPLSPFQLGVEPGQVLIAWGRHRGYSVIPKSVTKSRIENNFEQIKLSDEDYEKVSSFIVEHGGHFRFNVPINYEPVSADK
jgi:L-glyceraldehyde reductase